MMQRRLLVTFLIILTSGCSSNTKSTWDCPNLLTGKGNCLSIEKSDPALEASNSNSAQISNFDYTNSAQKIEIKLVAPKLSELKKSQEKALKKEEKSSAPEPFVSTKPRLRTEEKVGKVYFAPYIDSEGNQHSEYVVYVVDEEPKWVMQR
jgi:type IV conjugative transfer system lipoprotein TraV